jgi:hypothetical protein
MNVGRDPSYPCFSDDTGPESGCPDFWRDFWRWEGVGNSFTNALDSLAEGIADAIELIAYGLPFLLTC